MQLSLTRNEIIFMLYSLNKTVSMYEEEGKYGSSTTITELIKSIKEQTNIT